MHTKEKSLSQRCMFLGLLVLFVLPLVLVNGFYRVVNAKEGQVFASGIFRVYQGGQEVGTEEYTLSKVAGGWMIDSRVSLPGISMEQHFQANEDAEVVDYSLKITARGQVQEIVVSQRDGELDYGVKMSNTLVFSKTLPGRALLLDNNIWSHYILAIMQYDKAKGGAQQLKVLVPQAVPNGLGIADVSVRLVGTADDLDEYSVNVLGLTIRVWAKSGTYDIVKITIPAQSIEVMCNAQTEPIAGMPEGELMETPPVPAGVIEKEVVFQGHGTTLRGSLSLPSEGSGPWPGVVLIAGSGPTDRDGNTPLIQGRIDNLRSIAHFLSANGYVVLRYDKRGIGESDPLISIDDISFDYYVKDVVCAYEFLQLQEEVIRDAVSLAGHSEGALLSLMAATEIEPKSIMLLAGSGKSLGETILRQVEMQLEPLVQGGALSRADKDKATRDLSDAVMAVIEGRPYDFASSQVSPLVESLILSLVNQRPFAQKALSVDPTAYFANLDCPVLIVQGGADIQVLWEDAITLLKAAKEAELVTALSYFPVLDHVFKPVSDGTEGYADPERAVCQDFLMQLVSWLDWVHEDVFIAKDL